MSSSDSPLLIWGTGGHAISVLEAATAAGETSIAFCGEQDAAGQFEGFPQFPTRDMDSLAQDHRVVVAIGDNSARKHVVHQLRSQHPEIVFATIVHPSAIIASSATVGTGTVVLQGAILGAKAVIGEHCIVNTGSSLDHESCLSDFASLAPGVTTGGRVQIGECSAIGIGACLRHGVTVGRESVIGSASYVHEDLPDGIVAYGTPAGVIRHRDSRDPYLS